MKSSFLIFFIMMIALPAYQAIGQNSCQVLKPEINGTYAGDCKKGLAHGKGKATGTDTYEGRFVKGYPEGKGTYTWSTGEVYQGEWKKGLREGEGTYRFSNNGRDTLLTGIWEQDQYKGPKPLKPRVIARVGVDRYIFKRMGDVKDRVLLDFYINGNRNTELEGFMITSNSGYETSVGQSVGYEGIQFPVTIKINYTTWNNLKTAKNYVIFEFEISEPGDWKVEIHN